MRIKGSGCRDEHGLRARGQITVPREVRRLLGCGRVTGYFLRRTTLGRESALPAKKVLLPSIGASGIRALRPDGRRLCNGFASCVADDHSRRQQCDRSFGIVMTISMQPRRWRWTRRSTAGDWSFQPLFLLSQWLFRGEPSSFWMDSSKIPMCWSTGPSTNGWGVAGRALQSYAGRRRKQRGPGPRRILDDFLIGAYAACKDLPLLTLDEDVYRAGFPELKQS